MIKALVAFRDDVSVVPALSATGVPIVRVQLAQQDEKVLLGRKSEVMCALRLLLDCIGEQQGVYYELELGAVRIETGRHEASQPRTVATAVTEPRVAAMTLPAY